MSGNFTQFFWFSALIAVAAIFFTKVIENFFSTTNRKDPYYKIFIALGVFQGLYAINIALLWVNPTWSEVFQSGHLLGLTSSLLYFRLLKTHIDFSNKLYKLINTLFPIFLIITIVLLSLKYLAGIDYLFTDEFFVSNLLPIQGTVLYNPTPIHGIILFIEAVVISITYAQCLYLFIKSRKSDFLLLLGISVSLLFTFNDIMAGIWNLPLPSLLSFALLPELYRFSREIKIRNKQEIYNLESELERMERVATLGFSNAALAHDIRNVLTIINISGRLLKRKSGEEQEKVVNSIIKSSESANLMLDSYRRIAASNNSYEDKDAWCPPKKVIESIEKLFNKKFADLGILFEDNIPNISLNCEESDLLVLLFNLIKNAIDHLESLPQQSEKWLKLELDETENSFHFNIINGGKKIESDNSEDFFKISTSTKDQSSGSGLGLKIINRIAKQMGMNIFLNNDKSNTTFTLEIPVEMVEVSN